MLRLQGAIRTAERLLSVTTERIEPAVPPDAEAIQGLLSAASLAVADLAVSPVRLWVVRDGTRVAGAAGLERYGNAAILRSLVIDSTARGRGLGQRLVAVLEDDARASGVKALVLLTRSAAPFFERLGYRVTDRLSVSDAIRRSAEFAVLCPMSAVCMSKSLS